MKKRRRTDLPESELRSRATAKIPGKRAYRRADDNDAHKLLHELQVHQVELEMQNETIHDLQLKTQDALDRYIELYDFAPVGYLTLADSGQILGLNLTAAKLLGPVRSAFAGRNLADFLLDKPGFKLYLKTITQSDRNKSLEVKLSEPHDDFTDVQLESRLSESLTDQLGSIRVVMLDISRRKSLEREINQQRQELEALTRKQIALQTAAAIAHNMNQPLGALSLFSEVASEYLDDSNISLPPLKQALGGIIRQSHRVADHLKELLNFLEHGEVVQETAELNPMILNAVAEIQAHGDHDFHPVYQLDPELPKVTCNRLHVQKVLDNLLRNCVEAIKKIGEGSGVITTKIITHKEKQMVQVTIQDEGPGLDSVTAKNIFRPFFTTKPNGIGMGLAISRALIRANKGDLWLDETARPGATFHFTLPISDK